MPAPCNPWGGDVGDDLALVIPNSCSARRGEDPKKLSSAQKATTFLMQVGSHGAILPDWFDTSVMVKSTSKKA